MVKSRIPHMRGQSFGEYTALGVVRRGRLVGGVVYYGYRGFDIQIAHAFDAKGWALPGTLRALCAYPFHELGCERITAVTAKKNKTARAMLAKAGFQIRGRYPPRTRWRTRRLYLRTPETRMQMAKG